MAVNVATLAVVEKRLEPVQKAVITQPLIVTGQYLYDQFVSNDGSGTRMAWIRNYLVPNADPLQVKGATDEMVKIAHKTDQAAGIPEKTKGPKRNTAMNVRTFVQAIYGALKFAPEQMRALGFDESTGWMEARNMAKPALEAANKIWNGLNIPSKTDKEQKALAAKNKGETQAFLEATKATPRQLNESFESWQSRIQLVAHAAVSKARDEASLDNAEKVFNKLCEKHDRDTLALIMMMLQDYLKEANVGQSEISEEEANALLSAAASEGAITTTQEEEITEE
jgi:hypothetical protein